MYDYFFRSEQVKPLSHTRTPNTLNRNALTPGTLRCVIFFVRVSRRAADRYIIAVFDIRACSLALARRLKPDKIRCNRARTFVFRVPLLVQKRNKQQVALST